jgi:omega-6 fatty acid desaturase (delta-12 desaturase)
VTLPSLKLPNLPDWKEQALSWQKIVAQYSKPHLGRSIWQIINTFVPYLIVWFLMYKALSVSYWLTLLLAPVAGGLLVRIFIILHDCGHGSFFKSNKWNDFVGTIAGVLTLTPYLQWRHDHALHHAGSGDLERRGVGDVYTMTVEEYLKASRWQKIKYRIYRNPIVLLGIDPLLLFVLGHRLPSPHNGRRERLNLHITNLAILATVLSLGALIGFKELLLIQLPVTWIAAVVGVWLFYVQHQFEDTYWEHHEDWRYLPAALQGSSYFELPKVLQWFTGNIGFHHIHHLSPRIPNYNLEKAFKDNPLFQQVTTIHVWESLRTIRLKLWDEQQKRLVTFKHLKALQHPQ